MTHLEFLRYVVGGAGGKIPMTHETPSHANEKDELHDKANGD
jgi:hypothetical protein